MRHVGVGRAQNFRRGRDGYLFGDRPEFQSDVLPGNLAAHEPQAGANCSLESALLDRDRIVPKTSEGEE